MWLPRLDLKRQCAFCLAFFWITHSRGNKLPCHEDTQAALWIGPQGKEGRSPANNQHLLANHTMEPPWKQILQPQSSLQMNGWPLDYNLMGDPKPDSVKLLLNSWPQKLSEIICVYCYVNKLLSFRVIRYTAIDNYYIPLIQISQSIKVSLKSYVFYNILWHSGPHCPLSLHTWNWIK